MTGAVSVMGGSAECGAEFSPAGGMFAVDEALFAVLKQIRVQRQERAAAEGKKLTEQQLEAPLTADELDQVRKSVKRGPAASPARSMSDAELKERVTDMHTE